MTNETAVARQMRLGKLGKSHFSTVWSQVIDAVAKADRDDKSGMAAWLLIRTKAGMEWWGRPHLLPPEPRVGDFIAIKQVQCRNVETGEWLPQAYPILLVPLAEIDYMQVQHKGAPLNEPAQDTARTAAPALPAPDGAEGQPPGRIELRPAADAADAPAGTEEVVEQVSSDPARTGEDAGAAPVALAQAPAGGDLAATAAESRSPAGAVHSSSSSTP